MNISIGRAVDSKKHRIVWSACIADDPRSKIYTSTVSLQRATNKLLKYEKLEVVLELSEEEKSRLIEGSNPKGYQA